MIVVILEGTQVKAAYTNSPSDPAGLIIKYADQGRRPNEEIEPVMRNVRLVNEVVNAMRARGEDI